MEYWNREQLYTEVWETPLTKLAAKYNVSAVEIGKVCRKLQVPLPGRGHWAKKEFGKAPDPTPLPEAKNLPVVQRIPYKSYETSMIKEPVDPNNPEILQINAVEQKDFASFLESKQHKLISQAAKSLKRGRIDERNVLIPNQGDVILDLRVTKGSLERGLRLMNAMILALESEGFPVSVKSSQMITTSAEISGYHIPFALVERLDVSNKREVAINLWSKKKVADYTPTGQLEFRCGYSSGWVNRTADGKFQRLEQIIAECIGRILRLARKERIEAERIKQLHIEREQKEKERQELARQIAEEEQKLKNLESWVEHWDKAERMRRFVTALEKVWSDQGIDVSPDSPKGLRLKWMRQQADREDPMFEGPPSILDRKKEVSYW